MAKRVLESIPDADADRGMQVFHSNRAACITCHKAAHVGGTVGPSLRGVGTRRSSRDLVESILFPDASLVQSYETWSIMTDDGRVYSGVIQKDTPADITLSSGPDKSYRIPRDAIESMKRAETSVMPTGLEKTVSEQDLADLVAYLKTL